MRFDLIDIPAFGPFTDFKIALPASQHDIHLIYGENEAGKSSLLRGIHQMFYGIPPRTNDNFLHANTQLLTGAQISTPEKSLHFYRKKGNKNTLLNSERSNIDEHQLKPFLGSVDAGFFDSMFGLNTENLREGAQALLDPQSDLGTQIFSASLGGSPIDVAIKKLEAEADTLFKGRATVNVTIPAAIKAYKEGEKRAKSESTKVSVWNTLQKNIRSSQATFDAISRDQNEHNTRILHIANLLSALPNYSKLCEFEKQLTELQATQLPGDFSERFRKLLESIQENNHSLAVHQQQIEQATKKLTKTPAHSEILDDEAEIESLQRKIEPHLHHLEEVQSHHSQLKKLSAEISDFTEKLDLTSPEDISDLPIVSAQQHMQFRQVGEELNELSQQLKQLNKEQKKLETNIQTYRAEIKQHHEASDTSALEALLDRANSNQAKEKQRQKSQQELKKSIQKRDDFIARLDITHISHEEIPRLKLPSTDSITEEQQHETHLLDQRQQHRQKRDGFSDDLATEQTSLDRLKKKQAIYTQDDLIDARQTRDALVQTIKTQNANESLTGDIAQAIAQADTIADTLHSNTASIAKAEAHLDKIQILTLKKENTERSITETQQEINSWEKEWKQRCTTIPAAEQSPTDLLQWRELWEDLCTTMDTVRDLSTDEASQKQESESLLETMRNTLGEPKLDFATLHSQIKSRIKSSNQAHGKQQSTEKSLTKAELEKEQCTTEFNTVTTAINTEKSAWDNLCDHAQLPNDLTPSLTLDLITLREKAKFSYTQQSKLRDELKILDASIQQFTKHIKKLATRHLKSTLDLPTESLAKQLKSALSDAQTAHTRSVTIQQSIDTAKQALPALEIKSTQLTKELENYYKQAQVSDADAMEAAIISIEKHSQLTSHAESARSTLMELSDATPLADYLQQLDQQNPDALKLEKSALEATSQSIQNQRDEAKSILDDLKATERELKQAGDNAAQHKQSAANALSTIVTDTDRYIKLHHAIHFLKQQVEAYREKTQEPIIEKTSHYFNALTCGAFTGVAAQLDDKDVPQLVALRASDNQQVHTHGLSEGTLDQLYLALRLAAIDLHLDTHTAIPLILDDLLITFDDNRTRALLPVLEKLSQRTQILIFTHHHHLIDLTKKSAPTIHHHTL